MDCNKCPFNNHKDKSAEQNALFYLWLIDFCLRGEIKKVKDPNLQLKLEMEMDISRDHIQKAFVFLKEVKSNLKPGGETMTGQQLSDPQRIAFRIRHMGEDMIAEGLTGYGHSLLQYADWIEKVIW